MNEIQLIRNTNQYGRQTILFKILVNTGFVYMEVNKTILDNEGSNDSERVVIVDSKKFLELWKNDPNGNERRFAFGNESLWRKDYKFHHAEEGFSSGISNPVPLPYVHCYYYDVDEHRGIRLINVLIGKKNIEKRRPYCVFTDGITRTIWLLANGARCFPVMTDSQSYELLQLNAGIHESKKLIESII